MKIYQFTDYRLYLREWLRQKKKSSAGITFYYLAENIQVQKSTFSKILNGKGSFSSDQVYLLSKQVCNTSEEQEYFSLLVELEQTSLHHRKKSLESKIQEIQKERYTTSNVLKLRDLNFESDDFQNEYFNNPFTALVHVFLTIPKYQNNIKLISEDLNLDANEFQRVLELLVKLKLAVKVDSNSYKAQHEIIQIKDKGSRVRTNQLLIHSIALNRLATLNLNQRYGLCVSFSADVKTIESSRQILIQAVQKIADLTLHSKSENVYQLMIDFFPWSK